MPHAENMKTDAADPLPRRASRFARVRRIALGLLAGYLLIVVVMMLFENALIFIPTRYPEGNWHPAAFSPEDAWFTSDDGIRLHGWYLPKKNAKAAVLFCHGNGGNITHRDEALEMLHEYVGVSVLIFDYRGYGRSEGRPSERGVLADARAARKWLAARQNIAETDIVLLGESIGGAVAVDLAAYDGARALILQSTFDNLPNVAAYHYPWLPIRWAMRSRFDSASKIPLYHGPLLQSHGDKDTIVPYHFGKALFQAANEPKIFLELPGHNHNDFLPPSYYDAMTRFLDQLKK